MFFAWQYYPQQFQYFARKDVFFRKLHFLWDFSLNLENMTDEVLLGDQLANTKQMSVHDGMDMLLVLAFQNCLSVA